MHWKLFSHSQPWLVEFTDVKDQLYLSFWRAKSYTQVFAQVSAPLTPMLFQGQLLLNTDFTLGGGNKLWEMDLLSWGNLFWYWFWFLIDLARLLADIFYSVFGNQYRHCHFCTLCQSYSVKEWLIVASFPSPDFQKVEYLFYISHWTWFPVIWLFISLAHFTFELWAPLKKKYSVI